MVSVGINAFDEDIAMNLLEELSQQPNEDTSSGGISMNYVFVNSQHDIRGEPQKLILENSTTDSQSDYNCTTSSQTNLYPVVVPAVRRVY